MHDALLVMDHLAALGAAPALTTYAGDGRVEISGRVARQWAHKIGGLLRDELDAEPGDTLRVDLPPAWRAPLWALGALAVGVSPVPLGSGGGTDSATAGAGADSAPASAGNTGAAGADTAPAVTGADTAPAAATGIAPALATVTHDPTTVPADGGTPLALAAPALAMRWTGDLPAGALDASAEALAQPDELIFPPTPAEGSDLLAAASAVAGGLGRGARPALVPDGTDEAVTWTLATWLTGGSVVLLAPGTAPDEAVRLADVERATLRAAH